MNLQCLLFGHDWYVGSVNTWNLGESDVTEDWIRDNLNEIVMITHLPSDEKTEIKFCNRCNHIEAFFINNRWVNVGKAKAKIQNNGCD